MTGPTQAPDEPAASSSTDVADLRIRRVWVTRLVIGAATCAVLLVVGYLLLIVTAAGHEIDNEAYFGRESEGRYLATTGNHLLSRVTAGVMALALLVIVAIASLGRAFVVGLIAAAGVGIAMIGAQVLKATLPWSALVPSDSDLPLGLQRETYPSGHTTIGMSFTLALLLIMPAAMRWWVVPATAFGAGLFGVGVVIAGWHRPSDAIGGALWSGLVMTLAASLAVWLRGRERRAPLDQATAQHQRRTSIVFSAGVALCFYLVISAIAAFARTGLPDADRAFLIMIGLVIAAVFSVQVWFANVLAPVELAPVDTTPPGSASAGAEPTPHTPVP